MFQFFSKKVFPLILMSLLIVSCDGAAPGENAITPDNVIPVFTSESVISVVENNRTVITVNVFDADNDPIVYSITGGNDQAAFSIDPDTGELKFLVAPDFETPAASGGGNSYVLVVSADDDLSIVSQNLLISVTNADDNLPVASNLLVFDSNAGALVEGDTLISNYQYSDEDKDAEGASTIRWLRNGASIGGATSSTYVVTAADVGVPVSFEVTPVSTNGTVGDPVRSSTVTTTNNAPVADTVVISGDANGVAYLGNTLTGTYVYTDFESDTEGPTAFRWLRDGIPIVGVTQPAYTLVGADIGHIIRFEVTPFSNSGTSPGAVVLSAAVSVVNKAPTASPVTISGDTSGVAKVGDILSGGYVYFDLEGDLQGTTTFRWLRNGTAILNATASTYTIVSADVGKRIRFEVTPVSLSGTSPGAAEQSSVGIDILNQSPVASAVTITGDIAGVAHMGDTLTGSYAYTDDEGDAEGSSVYQWYRGVAPISGATSLNYVVALADVGSALRFEVTPVSLTGTSAGTAVMSATSIAIDNLAPVASSVTISGDVGGNASVGYVLTANYVYSDAEGNAENTSTFRWLRGISVIAGQTSINYTVTIADLGQSISVEVTPRTLVGTTPGAAVVSAGVTINAVPVASTVAIAGGTGGGGDAIVGDVLTGSYAYSDLENNIEATTTFRWLRDGVEIAGAVATTYTVVIADVGAALTFEATPAATAGTSPGDAVVSAAVNVVNTAPVASSVAISGGVNVGNTLTGSFTYSDLESDLQGTSTFRWLRNGVSIGVTAATYTLVAADSGTAITFEVTPVALTGLSPGVVVTSAAVNVNELPMASAVAISGTAVVGQTLTGGYTFTDADNVEGATTFRWLRNGVAISGEVATSYTVVLGDVGELLQFEVTPVSAAGSSPGAAVASAGVTPSNVFSSAVVCTTNENGIANKLGVSRFWRFSATQSQAITITASQTSGTIAASTSNPDLYLYKKGVVVAQETADTSTTQTLITGVTAGDDYVLELKEAHYVANAAPVTTACYDVSITYGGGFAKPAGVAEKPAGGGEVAKSGPSSCDPTGEINVSGTLTYDRVPHNAVTSGLDYASITPSPIKGAVVEVICGAEGYVYDSGVTDASGVYALKASNGVSNFVRVKAQMLDAAAPGTWNFKVVDNTSGGALYVMDTTPFTSAVDVTTNDFLADSGWGGAAYTGPRVSAPFAIMDSVYDAFQEVLAVDANVVFPALNINWSPLNAAISGNKAIGEISTSHYDPATGEVYILGDEDSDTDEFDQHVIIHEWAHYLDDNLSRTDSIGGAHNVGDILDMRLAFGEGLGNAYSGIVTNDPVYRDSSGFGQATGFDFDMDTDVCTNAGWFSECSVHELLYDFDTLLGFAPLYSVMINEQKNTSAFTSIFSFVTPLRVNNPGSAAAIDALVTGQSIDTITDIYGDSEGGNNPGVSNQLPIYEQF